MRTILTLAVLLVSLTAHAAPASQKSIEDLLAATKMEAMMNSMHAGIDQTMRQGMTQATQGKPLSAEQQRVLDGFATRFGAVMREEMSWQKMRPLYVQLYRDTFDQDEVDGMLAFYASPAGLAVVNKMPIVMQKSVALSQSLMQSFIPKMTAAMKDAMDEAKIPN